MKLNRKTHEKERIIKLIEKFYEKNNLELEAIINGIGSQYKLNYHNFVDTYQRLMADTDLVEVKPQDKLNIHFEPSSKYSDIRVTILGEGSIKNYCSSDTIRDIGYNVRFTKKHNFYFPGNKIGRVDVNDYHTRFNLKVEEDIDPDTKIIKDLKADWKDISKTFRRKQTHTFVTQSGLFNFDLSIVKKSDTTDEKMTIEDVIKYNKQNMVIKPKDITVPFMTWWNNIKKDKSQKVDIASQSLYYKKLDNSNVLTNPENYEIEIELNRITGQEGDIATDVNTDAKFIFNKFIEKVGMVLQAIQGSNYIMSETDKRHTINQYQKLIDNDSNSIFNGPLPTTLELKHIKQYTNREYNNPELETIRKNYVVTEKANGERSLLYIAKDNKAYLITRSGKGSQNLKYTGCSIPGLSDTLIDGEYITTDIKDNDIDTYLFFDVYYYKGKDVRNLPFGFHEKQKGTRQSVMLDIDNLLKSEDGIISSDELNQFTIFKKKYIRGDVVTSYKDPNASDNDTAIFEAVNKILLKVDKVYGGLLDHGHLFSYEVDGLIFMPATLGVGQNYKGDDIGILGKKPWLKVLKWQSPNYNSISFYIKMRRNIADKEIVDEYYNGFRYKHVYLKVSYHPNFHNDYYAQRIINEGLHYPAVEQFINFEPINPFHGYIDANGQLVNDVQIASVRTNNDGDLVSLEGEVIQEGNIVEFIYDNNESEERFKWKPLKIRQYNKANGFHTATNVWRSMKQPIDTKMITTGECSNICAKQIIQPKKEYLTKPMRAFHNYLKYKLLRIATDDVSNVSLMDLCSGKLSDMRKWKVNKVKFAVSIDNSAENIHNIVDGSSVKILKQSEKDSELRKLAHNTMIIYGDCSKNISNGSAGLDLLNQYYLNILYGNQEISGVNTKLEKLWGRAQQKFDIITCHFGIHNFFNDLETVENFMVNVAENLKSGGKFIGSCLDGETLFKELKTNELIEEVASGDNLIWKIKRHYTPEANYPKNHYSLGHKISVHVDSTTNEDQYLVHFDFLTDMMNKYGLQLLDSKMFNESPDSLFDSFESEHPKLTEQFNKQKALAKFSFMNRWFVFIKTKNRALSSMGHSMLPSSLFNVSESEDTKGSKSMSMPSLESEPIEPKILPEDIDYEDEQKTELSEYRNELSYDYDDSLPNEGKNKTTQKKTLQTILNEANSRGRSKKGKRQNKGKKTSTFKKLEPRPTVTKLTPIKIIKDDEITKPNVSMSFTKTTKKKKNSTK